MRCKGYHVDASRSNYETSQGGLRRAGLIFAEPDEPPPPFVWVDGILRKEEAIEHAPYQRFNKIPGMDYICYKCTLFKTLNEMKKLYPSLFDIYPRTFLLPKEFLDFQREHKALCGRSKHPPSWVSKPKNACCGRGISIIQSVAEAQAIEYESVIQQYITPFLIDGHKFDFRLYLLIASLQPLAIFIYKEGIARFCTQIFEFPSKANRDKKFMHLTNTAINKENSNEPPSKFTKLASEVFETISKRYNKGDQLWGKICEVCRAFIIGIYGAILNNLPKKCDEKSAEQKRWKMIYKKIKAPPQPNILNEPQSEESDEKIQMNANKNPINTNSNSIIIPDNSTYNNSNPQNQMHSIQSQDQESSIQNSNSLQNSIKIQNNLLSSSRKKPKITRPSVGESTSSKLSKTPIISPVITKTNNNHSNILLPSNNEMQNSSSNSSLPKQGLIEKTNQSSENDTEVTSSIDESETKDTIQSENEGKESNQSETENNNDIMNENESENPPPNDEKTNFSENALPLRKRYFHILGIDIMIDSEMNPKVLELNDRPSLGVTVDFELELKQKLISEAFEHISPNGDWFGNNENSGWIQIYPLPREEAAKSEYPKIVNNFLNPPRIGSDPQKLPTIQFPKRSVPDFLHDNEKTHKKKKKKKTRRESK